MTRREPALGRRLLVIGPGDPALGESAAPPPAAAAAGGVRAEAGARPGLSACLLAAFAADTPGLRQPPGAVFTGLPGAPGDAAMIVPSFDDGLMLHRSWYVMEKLREFLAAGRFDMLCLVHGAPAGLEALALARDVRPDCRSALVLAAPEAPPPQTGEAEVVAGLVAAELVRHADFLLRLPGAALPAGLDEARCTAAAGPGACLDLLAAAQPAAP